MSSLVVCRKEGALADRARSVSRDTPKRLQIGDPNDAFEQEAEHVADQIMAQRPGNPGWHLSKMSIDPPLQRECECGVAGECEQCRKKRSHGASAAAAERCCQSNRCPADRDRGPTLAGPAARSGDANFL